MADNYTNDKSDADETRANDMDKSEHWKESIPLSVPVLVELINAIHEKGASFRFQARGSSMIPAIRDGDVITLSPLGEKILRRGDVIAFRHPQHSRMLVHRMLRKKNNLIFVQGDNLYVADGWIAENRILGIVSRVERKEKSVYWPDRNRLWGRLFFRLYTLWPPVRRRISRGYRFLKK